MWPLRPPDKFDLRMTSLRLSFIKPAVFRVNMAASTSRPLEYLEGLPGTTFFKLYQQPSTALAIFRRMLPDLGIFKAIRISLASCSTNREHSKMLCHGIAIPEGTSSNS